MFTPENLYQTISQRFSHDPRSIMYAPFFNGAKNVHDFGEFRTSILSTQQDGRLALKKLPLNDRLDLKYMWMYDQEVLEENMLDIYRTRLLDSTDPADHSRFQTIPWAAMFSFFNCTGSFPIWCTSEINSKQIEDIESQLFVPCYYWYHALISRDWFRHWQYHHLCQPTDKSDRPFRFVMYCRATDGSREYRRTVRDSLMPWRQSILHDWDQSKTITPDFSATIDTHDAATSSIHLVLETLFENPKLYLTEKVFKPMVMSQPFVIFGPAGSLAYMKRYGFQTFSHVWDESYDSEHDPNKRLQKSIKLCQDLAQLGPDQFSSLYKKCMPAIEHNRKRFFSTAFMDQCWNELITNLDQAIQIRDQYKSLYPGGQICHTLGTNQTLLETVSFAKPLLKQILLCLDRSTQNSVLKTYPWFNDL